MKKLTLVFSFILASTIIFAQNPAVLSCINLINNKNLKGAKEYIDKAVVHPKTFEDAKAWKYYAIVYHGISDSAMYGKNEENKKMYSELAPDAMIKSYTGYLNALKFNLKNIEYHKLDINNNDDLIKLITLLSSNGPESKSIDPSIRQEIQTQRINYLENSLANKGIILYSEKKDYKGALELYEKAIVLNMLYSGVTGQLNVKLFYLAALASEKLEKYDDAISYYNRCIKNNYGEKDTDKGLIYLYLAQVYKKKGDIDRYTEVLTQGYAKFPASTDLLIEQINYYLENNKQQEAIEKLNLAIEKEPNNKNMHFALGTLYDKMNNQEKAQVSYSKALEIDSNYLDALYNIGVMYNNKGVELNDSANNTKDKNVYTTLKKQSDENFAKALPYLEKALTLSPDDDYLLNNLKGLYYRTGKMDKYNEVKKKLEAKKK